MPVVVRASLSIALFVASSLAATTVTAQVPSISSFSPQAVQPGQTVDVKIRGGNLSGASDLWTGFPCQAALTPDVADNGKNAGEVSYRFVVPPETPVGIYGVRVATPGGVSPLRLFTVDDLPTIAQQAGNKQPLAAQAVTLPCAVDGSVDSLARDYYKFTVAAGQRVSIEVLARRLGSPLDPLIRVLDANGRELTYSDDEPGLMGDSQLSYTFATAGDYIVEVSDVRYQGGGFFYRLRMGDFPCVTVPYPMGAKRGSDVAVTFAGSHVEGLEPIAMKIPADWPQAWKNVGAKFPNGQCSGFAVLTIGNAAEALEAEPNDTADKATRIELGANVNGRLDKQNDRDRYIFAAKKGQTFDFTAVTRSAGSPSDLVLKLFQADGKKVAEAEDSAPKDGSFQYSFPADGDYTLEVEDLTLRGGSQFAYRIEVTPSTPGFTLAASSDNVNIAAGGTAFITVTAVRKGYNGPIAVNLENPPAGVTSVPTVIGPGTNSVVLTVKTAPDAAGGKVFSVKIVGSGKQGETEIKAVANIDDALKGQWNALPWPPASLEEAVAVGVGPKPNFVLRTEPAVITFGRDLKATVKVIAERQKDFTEEIALATTPEKNGLPPGITVELKPIPKDANEIAIVLSADNKAPLGEFTGVLLGSLKKGDATHQQAAPGVTLKLDEPFKLTIDPGPAKVARKGNLKVKVKVERNPAFSGEIVLAFQNLPKGVTAAEAKIPADKSELEIQLSVTEDAQTGSVNNITVQGTTMADKVKYSATSPAVGLTVE